MAEGGAGVRAELASESADEAAAAAEVALLAARENAESMAEVIEAQSVASAAAEESVSLAESIRQMHDAQMGALNALAKEFRLARESAKPAAPEAPKSKPDHSPNAGAARWVRR